MMDPIEIEVFGALSTAVITSILTAYATSKANERVLRSVMDRVESLENRVFNHEKRLSRLEGKHVG